MAQKLPRRFDLCEQSVTDPILSSNHLGLSHRSTDIQYPAGGVKKWPGS